MKDIWTYAIERGKAGPKGAAPRPARGRVLRVKGGYNPNSSSVGSSIPTFLTLAAGTGALAVVVLNAMSVIGRLLGRQAAAEGSGPTSTPPGGDGVEPPSDEAADEPPATGEDEADD